MISSLPAFLRKTIFVGALGLILALHIISRAGAEENIAVYPPLPNGYTSIKVFDSQGRFVGRIMPEKRYWVTIDRIPAFLQNAVIAVEDSRFYEHNGIDIRGIARALVKDVVRGKMAEGGSTITQQLVKNKFLSGEKSIDRKIKEAELAMDFERKYTKKQILEMYFNEIYYGNGAWGITQAARLYFDKNPEELSEGECAMLAGVQKAPGRYNPLGKPNLVTGRRDVVLKRMVELKMITARQQKNLRANPPAVVQPAQASWYMAHVRNRLMEQFGAGITEQGGLEVTAALDLNLQKQAEKVLREGVRKFSPQM
ncbi:MAG TPA: transglycosylase domain-containing protein, partial [Geobacteraceae bacterium]|nr:transglycosylase domain-containing protein [Geobacteraceae bacterium]